MTFLRDPIIAALAVAFVGSTWVKTTSGSQVDLQLPGQLEFECPTFSWSSVNDAEGYDLVVFSVEGDGAFQKPETRLVIAKAFDPSTTSWTPMSDECLAAGRVYAWVMRVRGEHLSAEWSLPRYFEVSGGPSSAEIAGARSAVQSDLERRSTESRSPGRSTPGSASQATEPDATRGTVGLLTPAIVGDQSDPSGPTAGVMGVVQSADGVAVAAVNTAGGADLLLDGSEDGETNTVVTQGAVDRSSSSGESFDFRNSGAGSMELRVDGVAVVTTDTDTTCDGAPCDGSLFSNVDADLLDGLNSTDFAQLGHNHDAGEQAAICALFEASSASCDDLPGFCDLETTPRCFCEKYAFRSSVTSNADIVATCGALGLSCGAGGLEAADAICQGLAEQAGLPGLYMAWLSDDTGSPSTRFVQHPGLYCRADGIPLASSYDDLTDCGNPECLINPLNVTESGDPADGASWSNTLTDGTLRSANHCTGWSDNSGLGETGNPNATGSFWTENSLSSLCSSPGNGIYCFEQ